MHRVIHLKHQLPRRRRQNRTINGECILATKRRGKITAQIQSMVLLQVIKMLVEIRTDIAYHRQQIINYGAGILHRKSGNQIRVGRDVIQ